MRNAMVSHHMGPLRVKLLSWGQIHGNLLRYNALSHRHGMAGTRAVRANGPATNAARISEVTEE